MKELANWGSIWCS